MKTLAILQTSAPLIDENAQRYEIYGFLGAIAPIFVITLTFFAIAFCGDFSSDRKRNSRINKIFEQINKSKLGLWLLTIPSFLACIALFSFSAFAFDKSNKLYDQAVVNITNALDSKYGIALNDDLEFEQIDKITGPLSAATEDGERIQITFEIDNNTDVVAFTSGVELPTKNYPLKINH